MSTWLITGSSSGLGRDLARAVLDAGHNAVVTARNPDSVKYLADAHPETALAVPLDVTDCAQVAQAVRLGEERFGTSASSSTMPDTATAPPSRRATRPTSPHCSPPTSSDRWP